MTSDAINFVHPFSPVPPHSHLFTFLKEIYHSNGASNEPIAHLRRVKRNTYLESERLYFFEVTLCEPYVSSNGAEEEAVKEVNTPSMLHDNDAFPNLKTMKKLPQRVEQIVNTLQEEPINEWNVALRERLKSDYSPPYPSSTCRALTYVPRSHVTPPSETI